MGLDPERTFEVPEPVYRQMDLRPAGERAQLDWEAKLLRWREQFPEMAGDWDLAWRGRMREGWRNALPRFGAEEKLATREAARSAMASFARFAPTMIGGAADLVESTRTSFEGAGLFSRSTRAATSPSGSASTRWARSSTAPARTAGS